MQETPEECGAALRREREAQGISLGSIVQATKISTRHLEALEAGRFELLPGGLFNRSIVRSYVRAIDVPEDGWVQRFLAASGHDDSFREDDPAWVEFAGNVSRARGKDPDHESNTARWVGVVFLLVVVGVLTWYVWSFAQHRIAQSRPQTHAAAEH